MKNIIIVLFSIISLNTLAQTAVGKWATIDDKTNKKKSIVELYKVDEIGRAHV